jgi:hypothetical protein
MKGSEPFFHGVIVDRHTGDLERALVHDRKTLLEKKAPRGFARLGTKPLHATRSVCAQPWPTAARHAPLAASVIGAAWLSFAVGTTRT